MSDLLLNKWRKRPTDKGAFELWYASVLPGLLAQSCRITSGDVSLAEELLQDVVVNLVENGTLLQLKKPSGTLAYVLTAVNHRYIDIRRRECARPHLAFDEEHEFLTPQVHETPFDWRQLEDFIRHLDSVLSYSDSQLFEQLVCGQSVKEIAESAHISYSSAGVRIHRLRQKVRSAIVES